MAEWKILKVVIDEGKGSCRYETSNYERSLTHLLPSHQFEAVKTFTITDLIANKIPSFNTIAKDKMEELIEICRPYPEKTRIIMRIQYSRYGGAEIRTKIQSDNLDLLVMLKLIL